MGESAIVAPTGEVVALCSTLEDELMIADCDLNAGRYLKDTTFKFSAHRRPEHYGLIVETVGEVDPR